MTEQERSTINDGDCPDCRRRGFVLGPRGGMAQNIECANVECRARFNVVVHFGSVQRADRIERRSEGGALWPSEPKHH